MPDQTTPTPAAAVTDGQHSPDDQGTEAGGKTSAAVDGVENPIGQGAAAPATRRVAVRSVAAPLPNAPAPNAAAPVGVAAGAGVSFTIPLTVTVSLGAAMPAAVTPVQPVPPGPALPGLVPGAEALQVDPDWSDRKGYDPNFLGVNIPLPGLSAAMQADTVVVPEQYRRQGNQFALDYHHYTVAMRQSRCFAWYSAANIDGRASMRPKLPKRSGDKWHLDERINTDFQCGEELYVGDNTDRGHLTRYLDLGWGNDQSEALAAMADTFHFTNCCLQLSGFNQGKARWQGLETFLLEKFARENDRLMVVITGPVFSDSDPVYQNDSMNYSIPIPLQFWKVCVLRRVDGTLAATAFVMGQQDITKLAGFEAAFDVTATQRTIQDIEQMTGLDFGPLRQHDHFASGGAPGTLEVGGDGAAKQRVRPLRGTGDIVI